MLGLFIRVVLLLALNSSLGAMVTGDDGDGDDFSSTRSWSFHAQATSIGQHHGPFQSLYRGANSLPDTVENRVSLTSTAFLTLRIGPWEFTANPEIAGGKGFGDVTGIAGFPNGEIPRVATPTPTLYLARGYARYTVSLGGGREQLVNAANQAAGTVPAQRISFIGGKFAATDFFDNNAYSHDPRTQFMNWSIMYNGAWDYPADTRGYTYGLLSEIRMPVWSFRSAYMMEPTEANGPNFDARLGRNRGLAFEFERDYRVGEHGGVVRVLAYDNRSHAGSYREALQLSPVNPDLGPTRRNGTAKYGFGLNVEQALSGDIGLFARYGWNDGKTESWAFTEIDRTLSGGVLVTGRRWHRAGDTVGLGLANNGLSGDHRAFLGAGGYGFIIGDGRISYRSERILETFYALKFAKFWTVTAGYQRIANPAYNRDRGPVSVGSLRLHFEL